MDYSASKRRRRRGGFRLNASKMFTFSKLLKIGFFVLLALLISVPLVFFWFSRDLPAPGTLVTLKQDEATRIYDRNNTLLYSVFQDENRTYVKLSEIPKQLQRATIAIEDKDFYTNQGFSPMAYLRVARDALTGQGITGGSTISQQLVKNVLLQDSSRSLPRKIKELILAIQVNQKYSKDQILEMYLNNIPYGGTAVGVESASQMYFGKEAKELTLAQSAFLAGLPQSPSLYSPFSGEKYYLDRAKSVLRQMVENDYITQSEADKAYKQVEKFKFVQKEDHAIKAPHFVMYVKDKLTEQFGQQRVTTGGLQVTTTLDYDLQKDAEKIVKDEIESLEKYDVTNGAAIIADPKTGEILSMVGSKDYFDEANDGNFNVAISNTRQPGSSMKPIVYATALEKGYTAATMLMDVKTEFPTDDPTEPLYNPVNYDGKFRGPVQMRYSLANSYNIPAVKMLAKVGIEPVMKQAYDMGINNWEPTAANRASVGLSLVLGGRETSLMDEVTAYSVFANGGIKHNPITILKITDSKGKVLFERDEPDKKRVLSEEVSFIISHMLLDNAARTEAFGASSALVIPGHEVSVKTGTTDQKRDNWTVGYTPSYVVGVWVGNNDNSPMNPAIASGVTGASPIWHDLMVLSLKGKPSEEIKKPEKVVALQIDALAGGLPHGGQGQRSEYFVKGTEPTAEASIYKNKDGQDYLIFKEDDPVSKDGQNRWQKGIEEWIEQAHKDDKMYHPPDELKNEGGNPEQSPTPTLQP
ncbi:MAG: transglycosylase domain-containing protein [Patescibacteria group bacterium]